MHGIEQRKRIQNDPNDDPASYKLKPPASEIRSMLSNLIPRPEPQMASNLNPKNSEVWVRLSPGPLSKRSKPWVLGAPKSPDSSVAALPTLYAWHELMT